MVECLMKWETIDFDQINDIMEGREVRPPKEGSSAKTTEPLHTDAKVEEVKEAPAEPAVTETKEEAQTSASEEKKDENNPQ